MADYWTLSGFEDVYLEDSWILSINPTSSEVTLAGDFVLRESHPLYREPNAGEQYCYRRGQIRFTGVTVFAWEDRGIAPAVDASGESDLGSFDVFQVDGEKFSIAGDFGRIEVVAGQVELELPG